MGEAVRQHISTVSELTGAQAVQAMLMMIVTVTLMVLIILEREIPQFLIGAFWVLLGVYMELPSKVMKS